MTEKTYHRVGEKGFWIDQKYVGRVVAFREWPNPNTEPEVIADADTPRELELKMGGDFWQRDARGRRTSYSYPICRIL